MLRHGDFLDYKNITTLIYSEVDSHKPVVQLNKIWKITVFLSQNGTYSDKSLLKKSY